MNRPGDVDRFLADLSATAELLEATCSEVRAIGYFETLADLPLEIVLAALVAVRKHWKISRVLPTPGEIRELALGSVEDRGLLAWQRVWQALDEVGTYRSVDFGDPAIHGVLEQMGEWHQAWRWERLSERELGFVRRDFCQLYRLWSPAQRTPAYLSGQHEIQNALTRGAWTRGVEPELVVYRVGPDGIVEQRALPGGQSPLPVASPEAAESKEHP